MARYSKPVADVPEVRTYRVAGPHPVHATSPGETFTAYLEPSLEKFLLELGHVELVGAPGPDSDPEASDESNKD